MNWLVKWGVKKWLVGVVNNALGKYNVNIERARVIIASTIARIEVVIRFLKSVDAKIADGHLDEAEADKILDEAAETAKDLVG